MLLHRFAVAVALCSCVWSADAQNIPQDTLNKVPAASAAPAKPATSKWYDKISLRGYAQFRYNRLLETNPDLRCDQCDKGWGKGQEFVFRRARLVFSGDVHERLNVYIQFDYSSDASSTNKHFLQIRDAYFDLALDKKKEYRLRLGQSKVIYGFDNLQSSSNRLALDRSDALNSAAPNEREIGGFFLYAPSAVRALWKQLVDDGLKGSGDYGALGFGVYNGQTANKPELNDDLHVVARASYPFKIGGNQIIEPGIQAYAGKYTLAKDQLSAGVKTNREVRYDDRRVAASFVLYPRPFGIQAEYNFGDSPSFDTDTDSIRVKSLHGGYVTASYRTKLKGTTFIPFARWQTYDGAKKHELDARLYRVRETEIGVEWLPFKNFELTLAYVISHRQYHDFKEDYDESGRLLRVQVQFNY